MEERPKELLNIKGRKSVQKIVELLNVLKAPTPTFVVLIFLFSAILPTVGKQEDWDKWDQLLLPVVTQVLDTNVQLAIKNKYRAYDVHTG